MADQIVEQPSDQYEVALDEVVTHDTGSYHRVLIQTPWFAGPTDLAAVLRAGLGNLVRQGDRLGKGTLFVCEKLAVVATGRTVPATTVRVGRFARWAARFVRPVGTDLAQSIPERMQFVINRIGWSRTLLACAAAGLTRPLRVRGAFFVVAGREARDLDGMTDPYWDTLLPPLRPREARQLVNRLAADVGAPVAIVDINDRGGRVRAVSPGGLSRDQLLTALKDNPMGHCGRSTPIGIVRPHVAQRS